MTLQLQITVHARRFRVDVGGAHRWSGPAGGAIARFAAEGVTLPINAGALIK